MGGTPTTQEQLTEREQAILACLSRGLSDQQIAGELYLSLNTVKWYNRQIYGKLGVSSRTQAIASAKDMIPADHTGPGAIPFATLPAPPAPFIGRAPEINAAAHLLENCRLLTLTGPGGTGKTRLALRVAAEASGHFADGVYFIDLSPLSDHALVANAIAAAVGVLENTSEPLPETLKRALAGREMLLLIDNFEHVLPAAPLAADLLAVCPRLKILATSREALRLSGEQEFPVSPLSLPPADAPSLDTLMASEAGQLFIQRARMTRPDFAIGDDTAPAVADICIRLDGLPLAIELAAARCKLLTPLALQERLSDADNALPLRTLTAGSRDAPPRHRTMRDSIEWSTNLLDPGEKTLFARLAIFRGGRSLEAIEAVCGEGLPIDVLDGLASLVDKNLVQQKEAPNGDPSFFMLEMITEYARERLKASGELEMMQRRHADYFLALAERAAPELRLADYDRWCLCFEGEMGSLRAVLDWSLAAGDLTTGVRLASALCMFWYGKGYHVEAIRWTGQLLDRLDEVEEKYHPGFLFCAGHMAWMTDLDAARRLFERALEISRRLGDSHQSAWNMACMAYTMQEHPARALPLAEEALGMFREEGHLPGIAQTLNIIGEIARHNGDDARALEAYEESLIVSRQTGELRRVCYLCSNLTYIAQHDGDHARAVDVGLQGLRLARDRRDRRDMAESLETLAGSLCVLGQPEQAARLLGLSSAVLEKMGAMFQPADRPEIERINTTVRAALDKSTFETFWSEGRHLDLNEIVADVLEKHIAIANKT